ncbi:MAG: transglycosylase SLT domain-containing protein [Cyanobium sp.]
MLPSARLPLLLGLGISGLLLLPGLLLRLPSGPAGAEGSTTSTTSTTTKAAVAVPAVPDPPATRVALPSDPALPRAADGRHYPLVPADPATLAALLARVEQAVRDPATPESELPALGHQQQVIYRVLAHRRALADQVRPLLPEQWRSVYDRHLRARRAFLAMHRPPRPGRLPAWRIIQPEPPENLLRYYKEAAAATGIPWEVLAAINLVESGMGRIDGVSVADARGPMQFLPTTWAEPGIGNGGDIRDPRTAIGAAGRYLVRRGGLRDIRKGLWGYNNSDLYGAGVLEYAAILREDPSAYRGLYHWEVHFAADGGDLWLPLGYGQSQPIAVAAHLEKMPASRPPQGSSGY